HAPGMPHPAMACPCTRHRGSPPDTLARGSATARASGNGGEDLEAEAPTAPTTRPKPATSTASYDQPDADQDEHKKESYNPRSTTNPGSLPTLRSAPDPGLWRHVPNGKGLTPVCKAAPRNGKGLTRLERDTRVRRRKRTPPLLCLDSPSGSSSRTRRWSRSRCRRSWRGST